MKPRTLVRKPRREGRGRYVARRRVCAFCANKVKEIDYKDAGALRRYISDRGKIEPRRRTGTCARHQRVLAAAIKKARIISLLPFAPVHIRKTGVTTRAPAFERAPAVERTPAAERAPVAERAPATDRTPAAEPTPVAERPPATERPSAA